MGNSGGSTEGQNAYRNSDSEDQTHETSEESKDFIGNCTKGHSYYILAKNFSTFCPCPETLNEDEFKSNGLITLTKEISRQPSIQAATWILLAASSQVYSENQEQNASRIEKHSVGQKRSKLKVVDKEGVTVKEISAIKKEPRTLYWDNRKDSLRAS
jgi:hypothetical protein